jgi:hypothetical protein
VSIPGYQPDWARLFRVACSLIRQVNADARIIDDWTFGGGTALMLQIGHRDSHDVDFFLPDPQWLSFLDPAKRDFMFEIALSGHSGDGTGFLKLTFAGVGEIDFIVSQPKTANPTIWRNVEGERTRLETVAEIITKKVVHRGVSIAPRDIFDIAAAGERHEPSIQAALRSYKADVSVTLASLGRLNRDVVNAAIAQLQIRPGFAAVAGTAIERTRTILLGV